MSLCHHLHGESKRLDACDAVFPFGGGGLVDVFRIV